MRVWLRHVLSRMAEPRVATTLAVGLYMVCALLGLSLLRVDSSSGFGWVMKLPPALLLVASVVGVGSAWRGGYWGRNFERVALLVATGALGSGAVIEAHDLFLAGDTASFYTLAFLVGSIFLAGVRSWLLRRECLRAVERRSRVALLVG